MSSVPYAVYDADHHIYEPADAFLRHMPKEIAHEFYFVERNGRTKLVVNGQLTEYIPNPTFAVVAAPGVHEKWYRADNPEGLSMRDMAGKAIKPERSWQVNEGRLEALDQQGIHAAMLFPTLASVVEERFMDKPEVISGLFRSFNTWLGEEWGYNQQDRIFAVPMIALCDLDEAVSQLEMVLKGGARCVGIRPGPVPGPRGGRSPGFEEFDPFWARCDEAGIFVNLHASDSGYSQIYQWWTGGARGEYLPFQRDPLTELLEPLARPIVDTLAALIGHGLFDRHRNLRVVSVENTALWLENFLQRLDRAYGQMPGSFTRHPREIFHEHIFVAPAYEDDMDLVKELIPVNRILFGSDYPHPEGLAQPLDYLKDYANYSDAEKQRVFSSNLKGLLEGVRD